MNIGDLNLIRRLKNENYEYNLVVEGAFEHNGNRKVSKISGEIFGKLAQTIHMDWKKVKMFRIQFMRFIFMKHFH